MSTAQTITFPAVGTRHAADAPFALGASSDSLLTIAYSIVSGPATVTGSTLTLTGTAGTVVVAADQAGNGTYAAAVQVRATFTVALTAQAITAAFAPGLQDFVHRAVKVAAAADSTLAVAYSIVSGGGTIDAATGVMGFTTAGTTVVGIDQAGNGTYAAAPQVTVTVVVPALPADTVMAMLYSAASPAEYAQLAFIIGALGGSTAIPQFLIDRMRLENPHMHTAASQARALAVLAG